jgi:hypothetical protein
LDIVSEDGSIIKSWKGIPAMISSVTYWRSIQGGDVLLIRSPDSSQTVSIFDIRSSSPSYQIVSFEAHLQLLSTLLARSFPSAASRPFPYFGAVIHVHKEKIVTMASGTSGITIWRYLERSGNIEKTLSLPNMCLHYAYDQRYLTMNEAWMVLFIEYELDRPDVRFTPTNLYCPAQMAYLNLDTLKIVKGPRKAFLGRSLVTADGTHIIGKDPLLVYDMRSGKEIRSWEWSLTQQACYCIAYQNKLYACTNSTQEWFVLTGK